ncbi:MAG: co-chaperone GroES, partial [Thermoanaerobaculia bacterium]
LGDRVIVKRDAAKEKTEGGIIIPDIAREKLDKGEIIQIGTGKTQEDGSIRPLDVKIGDKILFSKYAGTEVKLEGEERLILHEADIFGVETDEPAPAARTPAA